jgi:hypothetical protein
VQHLLLGCRRRPGVLPAPTEEPRAGKQARGEVCPAQHW